MTYNEYKVTKTFNSPKEGSNPLQFRLMKEGEMFMGYEYQNTQNKTLVKSKEGFVIPKEYTTATGKKEEVVTPENVNKTVEQIASKNIVKDVMAATKKSTYFAVGGGLLGVGYAFFNQKSIMKFGIAGIVVGGLIGFILTSKNK